MQQRYSRLRWLFSTLFLLSCSPPPIYVVSTVRQSSPRQPDWISEHQQGMFIGIGEAQTMEAANRAAINDLLSKISQEIGVELNASGEVSKSEIAGDVSESARYQIDSFSSSLLRDVVHRVTNSYWEQCRVQTGKKAFNDFFRYFVLANIDQPFVDTLRSQTRRENERRMAQISELVRNAGELLEEDGGPRPADALNELTAALQASAGLFYDRQAAAEMITGRMAQIIRSLHIDLLRPYSEVRPERHSNTYQAVCSGRPAPGVRLRFDLSRGRGRIRESGVSESNGEVVCEVYDIDSQRGDNQITATLDIADLTGRIAGLKLSTAGQLAAELENAAQALTRHDLFSTLAKTAYITSSSLMVTNVTGYRTGLFRRVRSLDLSMNLTEHNGRDVTFDRYAVSINCWYVDDPIFATTAYIDSRDGTYGLPNPIKVTYSSVKSVTLSHNEALAAMINDLKNKHEIGMRQIEVRVVLLGRDDAGNDIRVEPGSEQMTWDRLFDR